jgi:pyridoxine kinase
MARVLAISSYVASGHIGLGAAVTALQALGHDVVALPTVILSNHPGHARWAGERVDPASLAAMLEALDANGILADTHAVLAGYLPTVGHVRFAAKAAARVAERRPSAQLFCDPVLGDDPGGLYIAEDAAAAIRDELVPLADMIFPNRFELGFLSRAVIDDVPSAVAAAQELHVRSVLATSIPSEPGRLANLLVSGGDTGLCEVASEERVPHGTGDLLAALFVGHRLNGGRGSEHLGRAVAGVAQAVAASRGKPELSLVRSVRAWADPAPLLVQLV